MNSRRMLDKPQIVTLVSALSVGILAYSLEHLASLAVSYRFWLAPIIMPVVATVGAYYMVDSVRRSKMPRRNKAILLAILVSGLFIGSIILGLVVLNLRMKELTSIYG